MKNLRLINMLIAFVMLFSTSLFIGHMPQAAFAAAGEEVSDDVAQYAAVDKTYSNELAADSQEMGTVSAELDEINSILKATSRKIALLNEEQKPVVVEPILNDASPMTAKPKASNTADDHIQRMNKVFEQDIRQQTMEDITSSQSIQDDYKRAKQIENQSNQEVPLVFRPEEPIKYQTQAEIIKSVLSPELVHKRVDLDFDETSLGDIIQTVSKLSNVNIVLDPSLKMSKFDLHLTNVTIQEALLLIADSFKLGFKRVGDSLYATLRDELLLQNQTSRVFRLKNINVEQAKNLLGEMSKKIDVSPELNSLIAVGQPEEIEKMEKAIERLDHPQPQVVLEAKIIEITRDGLKEVGIDWSDQITTNFQETGRPVTLSNNESAAGQLMKIYSFARNPIQFDAVIHMLENQNKAKVLSSPRVTTINGKESQIFVGDRIPYTVTNVTGGVATTDVRWVEPGIRLTITPSIIGDDFVVIKVEPEVSFIFAFRGPNNEFPHIKTREATAYVRIKNNEPFILGGLLSQEDKKNLYKVPLLGSIPWLGNLFSHEQTTSSDVELIISITPTIVYGNLN